GWHDWNRANKTYRHAAMHPRQLACSIFAKSCDKVLRRAATAISEIDSASRVQTQVPRRSWSQCTRGHQASYVTAVARTRSLTVSRLGISASPMARSLSCVIRLFMVGMSPRRYLPTTEPLESLSRNSDEYRLRGKLSSSPSNFRPTRSLQASSGSSATSDAEVLIRLASSQTASIRPAPR